MSLLLGVKSIPLETFVDERGELTEIYNDLWKLDIHIAQWNFVRSKANVLRGLHVHLEHSDFLCLPEGKMFLGLKDLRQTSPTFLQECVYEISFEPPAIWIIPPGVAHGFYFPENSIHCYGLTKPWKFNHKLGCAWNSDGINLNWPVKKPILSEQDAAAMSLAELLKKLADVEFIYDQ